MGQSPHLYKYPLSFWILMVRGVSTGAGGAGDHSILLDRLSLWFGVHGTALNWFKSYLSDRLFCVKCSHDLSKPHRSCYGVPQGSVLRPLLFSLYTTPLSSLISSFSLSHHFIC